MKKSRILVVALLALCLAFSAFTLTGCGEKLGSEVFMIAIQNGNSALSRGSVHAHGEDTYTLEVSTWSQGYKPIGYQGEDRGIAKLKKDVSAADVSFPEDSIFANKRITKVERVDDQNLSVTFAGKTDLILAKTLDDTNSADKAKHSIRLSTRALENTVEGDYIYAVLKYDTELPAVDATWADIEGTDNWEIRLKFKNFDENPFKSVTKENIKLYISYGTDAVTSADKATADANAQFGMEVVDKKIDDVTVQYLKLTVDMNTSMYKTGGKHWYVTVGGIDIGDGCEGSADDLTLFTEVKYDNMMHSRNF